MTLAWPNAALSKNYEFVVFANNGSGSRASNIGYVKTFDLNAPFNLTVGLADPFNVSMFWDEASTTENGFSLERKIGTGPWTILTTNAANDLDLPISQYTQPSTTYSFRVRAYRGIIAHHSRFLRRRFRSFWLLKRSHIHFRSLFYGCHTRGWSGYDQSIMA